MIEKSEEQTARDKAHVAALRNAQAMMTAVLDRNAKLEQALSIARNRMQDHLGYVADGVYAYKPDNQAQRTVREVIKSHIDAISAVLG